MNKTRKNMLPPSIKRQRTHVETQRKNGEHILKDVERKVSKKALTPESSKKKLTNKFITALQSDFDEHGEDVIKVIRKEYPDTYFKVVSSIMPKEFILDTTGLEGKDIRELEARYEELRKEIEDEFKTLVTGKDSRTRQIEATAIDVTPETSAN